MNEALNEWLDKTEWVQKTAHPSELGMHRADVIKARYDALVGALTLIANAENSALDLAYCKGIARSAITKATGAQP